MLTYEQFSARINLFDAEQAKEKARQSKFIDTFVQSLIDISIQQFPETEQYKHIFIKDLTKIASKKADEINRFLYLLLIGTNNDEMISIFDFNIPDRDVTIAEQQYLDENLKMIHLQQHPTFIKLNAERVKNDVGKHNFRFVCFDKTKELISEHFPELIDNSGNIIYNIDKRIYLIVFVWVQDFFNLAGNYINKTTTK